MVVNFSTIPEWMFKLDKPVPYPADPNELTWTYEKGKELRDPSHMNYFYLLSIAIVDLILLYVGYSYLAIKKNKEKKMFRLTRNLSLAAIALALIIFTLIAAIF